MLNIKIFFNQAIHIAPKVREFSDYLMGNEEKALSI